MRAYTGCCIRHSLITTSARSQYLIRIGSNGAVREKSPLCCTGLLSQSIEDQVETIYKMALENSTHTRIDKKAKALIDRYMDLKNLPF